MTTRKGGFLSFGGDDDKTSKTLHGKRGCANERATSAQERRRRARRCSRSQKHRLSSDDEKRTTKAQRREYTKLENMINVPFHGLWLAGSFSSFERGHGESSRADGLKCEPWPRRLFRLALY